MKLKGKNIIVTGGTRGIGRGLVKRLAAEGANVGVLDIDQAGLEKLKKDFKGIHCFACDVSDSKKVKGAVAKFCEQYKTVDALINNASIIYNSPLVSIKPGSVTAHDVKMWDKVISVNLNSVFYVSLAVVENMISNRTKGVIVNIGSVGAGGNPGQSAYSASKAAVSTMTATWAKELSPLGIRVVCVAPGFTDTETTRKAMQENVLQEWIKKVPLKRLGKVEEVVDCIIFAIENDFINGKTLQIDGGLTL